MANPDASRNAAHKRYAKAAEIAAAAGSNTQAGLNEAYNQLYKDADWRPDSGWASNYQEGPAAYITENTLQQTPQLVETWQQQQQPSAWNMWNIADRQSLANGQVRPQVSAINPRISLADISNPNGSASEVSDSSSNSENPMDSIFADLSKVVADLGQIEKPAEKKYSEDGRELNPQFSNDPRYIEMMNSSQATQPNTGNVRRNEMLSGVSDMGTRAPEEGFNGGDEVNSIMQDITGLGNLITDPNAADKIFLGDGPMNPDNWAIVGSSDAERQARAEREQYRKDNPMPEGAIIWTNGIPQLSDEYRQIYQDYFDSKGGLQQGYETGLSKLMRGLSAISPDRTEDVSDILGASGVAGEDAGRLITGGLDQMANENYDDGETMRADAVKGGLMSGKEYKELQALGMGGRPASQIDDNATYSKLDEMRDFGFIPYIEDEEHYRNMALAQIPNAATKTFDNFAKTRERMTDASIKYNGQQYSRDDFYANVVDYRKDIDELERTGRIEVVPADDPRADPDSDMPITRWWTFPGTDVRVASNDDLVYQWSEDGSTLYAWLPGHEDDTVAYDGLEDFYANEPEYSTAPSGEGDPVHMYYKVPKLEYTQADGTDVSLSYDDADRILKSLADGTADLDFGFLDLAKDAGDRKGFGDMITSGDFGDLAPNMVDLITGSAALFNPYTAWGMAAANAGSATQGLDPRIYNSRDNSYSRLAEDMTGEKYLSNIVLSGLVPATEHVAGIIGGSGGFIGKPLQAALGRIGAPAPVRSAVDVLGEGVEESVASTWEDYQTNGLGSWFADPLYELDEFGNVVMEYDPVTGEDKPKVRYDSTGHEMRDPTTSLPARVRNWGEQQLDNIAAGTALGLTIGGPRIASDVASGSGYYGKSKERKLLRDLEKQYGVGKFREAKRGNTEVHFTPEDIGTYGKREK